jgi:hypothetical protein
MPEAADLPILYFLCLVAVLSLLIHGWTVRREGWGIPSMAVTATAGTWYLIDPIYNGYNDYVKKFGEDILNQAWLEILLFFISFAVLTPIIHRKLNADYAHAESAIFQLIENKDLDAPFFQDQVDKLTMLVFCAFCILSFVGLILTDFDFVGLFFPYMGQKAYPWNRGRVGTGFDFLIALAIYLQLMLNALLGVVFALATRTKTMIIAGLGFFLATPFFLFDRTRSYMLAVLMPGFLALVAIRMKGGLIMRMIVVFIGFTLIDGWFKFVIENRDLGDIAVFYANGGMDNDKNQNSKHLGFNMFEELGYINELIGNGTYKPNWGARYFAELVNPIPRVLWPEKPLIGIDYAIARGMGYGNQDMSQGGVAATLSTGMIGQGVVNFGFVLGPIAAAALMAFWVAVLARQDLMGQKVGNLLLYGIGLVLTYNMGRDITLLILYPFVFGWLLLYWINKQSPGMLIVQDED